VGGVGLGEHGAHRGSDHLGGGFGHPGQHVAHEVHPAALPARPDEHAGDRLLEAEMVVADDELHAGEPPGPQRAQERRPEGPVFGVTDLDAEDFPVTGGGDARGDDDGPRHDPALDAGFDVGGVAEHVGEPAFELPGAERLEVAVELGADAAHLRLGDPRARPERFDQVVDLAGRHPVDPRLHDHREQGPVDPAAPFQQRREE